MGGLDEILVGGAWWYNRWVPVVEAGTIDGHSSAQLLADKVC